jgi:hypothetical protein
MSMACKRALFIINQSGDDCLFASVSDAPFKVRSNLMPLGLVPHTGKLDTQQEIEDYGGKIRDALMAHPEIRSVLEGVDRAPHGENWNLLFGVSSPAGEAIRWEVIRTAGAEHMVLNGARRLFRVPFDPAIPDLGTRYLPDRLRFVGCLSPAQIDSTEEFNGLVAAAAAARKEGLRIDLTLYVGQRSLLQQGQNLAPEVDCQPMPDSTLELQDTLKRLRPHILHFFCHGRAEDPPSLQFATLADQRANRQDGSVPFSVDRLVDAHVLDQTWTVVFNCCDGGRPGQALNSMAYRVVTEAGIPAAIGMGSPLPAGAAPLFSGAFYKSFFVMLARLASTLAGLPVEVDFGEPIAEARRALHEAIQASEVPFACWSLPIIYLHRRPFHILKLQIQQPGAGPQIAARIRTIAGMLQHMPITTPLLVRQQILALFDEEPYVPPGLRCDENGQFPISAQVA